MTLDTDETKGVVVGVWNAVDALPNHTFSQKAFDRIVAKEFNRALIAKMDRLNPSVPMPVKQGGAVLP